MVQLTLAAVPSSCDQSSFLFLRHSWLHLLALGAVVLKIASLGVASTRRYPGAIKAVLGKAA